MLITILSSSVLICLVLLIRYIFRGKVKAGIIYALWGVVLLRLLIPVQIFALPAGVQDFITADRETGENDPKDAGQDVGVVTYEPDSVGVQADEMGNLYKYNYTVNGAEGNDTEGFAGAGDSILPGVPEDKSGSGNDQIVTGEDGNRVSDMGSATGNRDQTEAFLETVDKETVLVSVWAVVAVVLLAAIFISNLYFYRRLKKNRRIVQNEGRPSVYRTDYVHVPCLYGLFCPAIYLPDIAEHTAEEQEYIISHERMHYRHLDHVWSVVRILLICVYWFNPLVWIAARVSKQDAEYAADEAVVKNMGYEERFQYGKAILGTLRRGKEKGAILSVASTASSSKREITKRIENISTKGKTSVIALVVMVALVLSLTACAFSGRDSVTNGADGDKADTASPGAVSGSAASGTGSQTGKTEDQKLDEAISKVLKEDMSYTMALSSTWQYTDVENLSVVESHMLLEKEETEKEVTVYVVTQVAAYGTGVKEDGKKRELFYTCRGISPDFCVITFEKKDGNYVTKETWHAEGKKDKQVREMFPKTVSDQELSWIENDYILYLTGENQRKAYEELKKNESAGTKEDAKTFKPLENIDGAVVSTYDGFGIGASTDYDHIPELTRNQSGVSEFTKQLVDAFNSLKLVPVHDLNVNSMDVRKMITIDFISDNQQERQIMFDDSGVCWVDGQPKAFMMDEQVFDYNEIRDMVKAQEARGGRCRSPFTSEEIIDAETDIQFLNELLGNSSNINGGFLEARAKKLCKINGTTRYEEYKSQCEHFLAYKKMYLAAKNDGVTVTDDEAEAYINDLKNSLEMLGEKENLERYCKQKGISEKIYWEFARLLYKLQYPTEKIGDNTEEFQKKLDEQEIKILDGPHVDLSVKKSENVTKS